ncbi:hypothetical protein SI65_07617 [Aspergillus cristatus]|uniref:Uncharacterized protein n=1 Tax=Aspergillus cristatus TaxID=573508 RepID=A0A1E3B8L1_ASPCR|nr:hypothetical protein SI65_07617 [Aspergillus cristatus]
MASTQPPYYTSSFGNPNQDLNSTTPTGTYLGETGTGTAANTTDPRTGPAPSTAGPHRTDMGNAADPRVDSDLNNRAQYAPGTTTSGTVHPGTNQGMSNPENTRNSGPHRSSILNKLDPRVDSQTGNTTTKSTNMTGSGAGRSSTYADTTPDAAAGSIAGGGSSTGSTGGAPGVKDTRSHYDPRTTGYNSATGSGYQTGHSGGSYDPNSQDYRAEYASSTANKSAGTEDSKAGRAGDEFGKGIQNAYAGIHGAGESLRGALNAAVDRTFGSPEGVEKNQGIARKGEEEIRSGLSR